MNSALTVRKPLTLRLLRRILAFSAVCILILAGLRAWVEYAAVLEAVHETMDTVQSTLTKPLAASLWEYDQEQINLQVEGILHFPHISYAVVTERGRVLSEAGVRQVSDVLEHDFPLTHSYRGQEVDLGRLHVQADLLAARQRALSSALRGLAFSAGLVLFVALLVFQLTRNMVSQHLARAAAHLQFFQLEGPGGTPIPLVLDKKPAGDELDVLAQAVNTMQDGLAASYAQVLEAQAEVRSQARFPLENPSPVLRANAHAVLVTANPASAGLLLHLGVAVGQKLPEPYASVVATALTSGEVQHFEDNFGGRVLAFAARPVLPDGFVNIYGMDITARQQAELDLRRSLHEKEILLKEIHHRVKNNLQIISSLLFLQAEYVIEPLDRTLFMESQKRIQAMALVHEELYSSADLSSVGMREYVTRLVERVASSAECPVETECSVDDLRLPVTQSIPCGLVLNELVMNAVKHAFRNGARALLRVGLHRKDGGVVLTVEDNGPGLPPDFDLEAVHSLGLTLVTSLAAQLSGSVTAENLSPGARFTLRFPLEEA